MYDWQGPKVDPLTALEAFDVMTTFLEEYWNIGLKSSDDIAGLLGSLDRGEEHNLPPIDLALWQMWKESIDRVRKKS